MLLHPWAHTHEETLETILDSLDQPMAFIHRNEFWRDYAGHDIELPSILVEADGKLEILVPRQGIEDCRDLDALINLVSTALQELTPA